MNQAQSQRSEEYLDACWANYDEILELLAQASFKKVWPAVLYALSGGDPKKAVKKLLRSYRASNINRTTALILIVNAKVLAGLGAPLEQIERKTFGLWWELLEERILFDGRQGGETC